MINYDKDDIKENLETSQIFEWLDEWGGDPVYTDFGIISKTICHHEDKEGSRKLYYYENSKLFQCWTSCGSFDIFDLIQKIAELQWKQEYNLYEAIKWVAYQTGYSGEEVENNSTLTKDWEILTNYNKTNSISIVDQNITLKQYDSKILNNFNYQIQITPWIKEGIKPEIMRQAHIGFYPGGDQITIPHYDSNGNFIGLRGRTICQSDAEMYGKYHPLKIGNTLYNHPLGFNLYNLNNSKKNIAVLEKAIVFESEKSTLQYRSYFGVDNDISVATCGSNLTWQQVRLLLEAGAKEIIVAFDRQFQEINDEEYKRLINKFYKINNRYKNFVKISFIFDKNKITSYKASPTDEGSEKFLELFKERVII